MDVNLQAFLVLGAVVFCIGLYGALSKRNAVSILMSIEIMLNAVNITLVAFASSFLHQSKSRQPANRTGVCGIHYYGCRRRGFGGVGNDHSDLPAAKHRRCRRDQLDAVVAPRWRTDNE